MCYTCDTKAQIVHLAEIFLEVKEMMMMMLSAEINGIASFLRNDSKQFTHIKSERYKNSFYRQNSFYEIPSFILQTNFITTNFCG